MTTPLIIRLEHVQTVFTKDYIPVVYVVGIISNILNIILFCRRKLRCNCCSWYFICLSLSQILLLNVNCVHHVISSWLNYDGFSTITSLCKIHSYFNVLSIILVRHFICLISIDRWLVTSANARLRNKSSLINIPWIVGGSFTFWTIFSIHAPINYMPSSTACSPIRALNYAIFLTIYNVITSSTPFFIVFIFSILTVFNIRKSIRQVNSITHVPSSQINTIVLVNSIKSREKQTLINKRLDMVFVRLTVFQIIPYLLFNLISSFSAIILYLNSITSNHTEEENAIVSFIHELGTYLLCTYVSITFIFYTLASNVFRKEFILLCKQCWFTIQRCLCCQH
ncbi:unnamed protein product [Rotaria sp. Silwood2]|nr:unnamed protein product [Rotaria sp. Silwood2]CAF2741891.1 unnamed protein product [Rotaria sp. Silwood2]CAF3000082.1 unnamed protein product [Rotaria sp. Silwood2]CAF3162932.1 unnamed protein product [Rotaria sp. Silwood2]CAF4023162.1 unnamed protein product [Rotaria sp. Silwood2]